MKISLVPVKLLALISLLLGIALGLCAVYGAVVGIRSAESVPIEFHRFDNDLLLDETSALRATVRQPDETEMGYAQRLTSVIQKALLHLDRWTEHDPDRFYQRLPFHENPFLYVLGHFRGLPQIERYHFSDPRRTIHRGIAICGDHAIVLSALLAEQGIDNAILSARAGGHVIVEILPNSPAHGLYDADFGVFIPGLGRDTVLDVALMDERVLSAYRKAGYSNAELDALDSIYSAGFIVFDGVYGFMAKRYIFERVSYFIKWMLPLVLIIAGVAGLIGLRYRNIPSIAGTVTGAGRPVPDHAELL